MLVARTLLLSLIQACGAALMMYNKVVLFLAVARFSHLGCIVLALQGFLSIRLFQHDSTGRRTRLIPHPSNRTVSIISLEAVHGVEQRLLELVRAKGSNVFDLDLLLVVTLGGAGLRHRFRRGIG